MRLCDEAVFLSFFLSVEMHLSIYSIHLDGGMGGWLYLCVQTEGDGRAAAGQREHGVVKGRRGGGGRGRRKGLENKKIGLS